MPMIYSPTPSAPSPTRGTPFGPATLFGLSIALVSAIASANPSVKSTAQAPMEEVVVVSSRFPVPMSEVVGSVVSISSDNIDARMVNDLSDLLSTSVGISVNRRQAYGRTYNDGIAIRGLGGKRVNILVDGVRVADAYTGYGRDVVDMDLLKRVEILKGPSSALYGSDGLAGVVSYVTKDPSDLVQDGNFFASASTLYESASERVEAGLVTAMTGDKIDWLFQVTQHDLNETNLHDDATLQPNPMSADRTSAFSKIKYALGEDSSLTLTLDMQRSEADWDLQSDVGTSFGRTIVNTSESLGTDKMERDRFALSYDFEQPTAWFDRGSANLFYQSTDQRQITREQVQTFGNGIQAAPTKMTAEYSDYQFNQSIGGVSLELFKEIATSGVQHQLVYGAEWEEIDVQRPRYKTSTDAITNIATSTFGADVYPNKTFPDTKTQRSGLYFNDRMSLSDRATLVVGLRYDHHELKPSTDALFNNSNVAENPLANIKDGSLSKKIGLLFDVNEHVTAYAQYAEGFRSPDYESANLTFTNFAYYYSVAPNPDLTSEESAGYEVGLRGGKNDFGWSLALYRTSYDDFIETALTGSTPQGISIYQYVNLSDVTIKGAEFEMTQRFSDNWNAKFAANRTYGNSAGEALTTIDPSEAVLSLQWRSDDANLGILGVATLVASGPDGLAPSCGRGGCNALLELPGRVTYDLFVDYRFSDNLSAKVGVTNLTDVKYWDWDSVNGKLANDPNLELFLETGREAKAMLKYAF